MGACRPPFQLSLSLAFALTVVAPHAGWGQRFDFSGVDRFWVVWEMLATDAEPTAAQWDSLFATPGYAALREREPRWRGLDEAFRLAYQPARAAGRDSAATAGGFPARILPHLVRIPEQRARLERFRRELERRPVLDSARSLMLGLLPAGLGDTLAPPPVAVVFFAADGRGYPSLIVSDLLRLSEAPDLVGFFAHEMFHYALHRVARAEPDPAAGAEDLVAILGNVYEEGIADQLDKADIPELSEAALARRYPNLAVRAFYVEYREAFAATDRWLALTDEALRQVAAHPDSARSVGLRLQRELPIGGRPLGAFMARAILQDGGVAALRGLLGRPLGFWLAYQHAAARRGLPRLSDGAVAVIETLRSGEVPR